MADREFVRSIVRSHLRDDNQTALLQSGSQWEEETMDKFYLTEIQVNDSAESIMKDVISFPENDLPDKKWKELKETVNLSTKVKETIDKTTTLSAFATPAVVG